MRFSSVFSLKDIILRARGSVSLTRIARYSLIVIIFVSFFLLILDIFIFYRYSYLVVNLEAESTTRGATIDREGLRKALEVLDARAKRFGVLYGSGTTTPRSH